jgi:hypothetical protein
LLPNELATRILDLEL